MHQWRILLDLDGTIARNAGRRLLAQQYGVEIPDDLDGTSLMELLGLTDEQFWAWWHQNQEEIYDLATPIPGAVDVIRTLKREGAYVAVVTARRAEATAVTLRWLAANQVPYDQFVIGSDDKVAVAEKLSLNLAFEDDPGNGLALAALMPVCLIESRRSRKLAELPPNLHMFADWTEVPSLLRMLQAKSA